MPEIKAIKTAEDYIAAQLPEYRGKLEELQTIIKETIPGVEEFISRQIINYKYLYALVGIGVKKNCCSLNTMNPNIIKRFQPRLGHLTHTGATLHFPLDEPLPKNLIRDIVLAREKQNLLKEELKKIK